MRPIGGATSVSAGLCRPPDTIEGDGPPRMVKRPTGSGGEPSSPNCGASAGVRLVNLISSSDPDSAAHPALPRVPWPGRRSANSRR